MTPFAPGLVHTPVTPFNPDRSLDFDTCGKLIDYMVDINPAKQGKFAAGTGHEIVGPDHLRNEPPDVVLVMNPVYLDEISESVRQMGIDARVLTV